MTDGIDPGKTITGAVIIFVSLCASIGAAVAGYPGAVRGGAVALLVLVALGVGTLLVCGAMLAIVAVRTVVEVLILAVRGAWGVLHPSKPEPVPTDADEDADEEEPEFEDPFEEKAEK